MVMSRAGSVKSRTKPGGRRRGAGGCAHGAFVVACERVLIAHVERGLYP